MTALSAPTQLVYLQLVREAFGRRRNPVAMTLDRMQARTGLSRSTIHQALQRLAHPDVDIVNVVHPGGKTRRSLRDQTMLLSKTRTPAGEAIADASPAKAARCIRCAVD
ncbi:MAG: helix-turn-helix domain-containing protein [Nitrospira sp.]|nr:helix-turn-helix domain-containing protein [Nitrospira sp.]